MRNKIVLIVFILFASWNIAQINFIKTMGGPVIERTTLFGEWNAIAASDPHVLFYNDTLHMWYTGVGWSSSSDTSVHQRIGYTWSLDGLNWNEHAQNPVLGPSTSSWDDLGVETPTVIIDPSAPSSEKYKLWYAGQNSTTNVYDIGYATSPDGINWNKYSSSVLQTGLASSWENAYLEGPSVLLHNDTLKMWYASVDVIGDGQPTDFTGNIGYAWSLDGINWNKHVDNPVFTSYNSTGWDLASVADPHVIYHDGKFHMFYAGLNSWSNENFKMGYAYSFDGINWIRPTTTPVLELGTNGDWDDEDASYGCVIYNASINKYQMWYTGIDSNYPSGNLTDYYYEIGYASATNTLSTLNKESFEFNNYVYPNPTLDLVTLGGMEQNLAIISVSGQVVTPLVSIHINANNKTVLNLSLLDQGVYMIITKSRTYRVYKN